MTTTPFPTKKPIAALTLIICVSAGVWFVWAQTAAPTTVLGCLNAGGDFRAIYTTGGACKSNETPVYWYTKTGADTTFLRKTDKAIDADLLDGLDSSDFLTTGTAAGGALTGTYPSPLLAEGIVRTSAIQDGAVTAAKLAPGIALPHVQVVNFALQAPSGRQTVLEIPNKLAFTAECPVTGEARIYLANLDPTYPAVVFADGSDAYTGPNIGMDPAIPAGEDWNIARVSRYFSATSLVTGHAIWRDYDPTGHIVPGMIRFSWGVALCGPEECAGSRRDVCHVSLHVETLP